MKKDNDSALKTQDFVGKYEELNPISSFLINNFYKNIQLVLPSDIRTILEVGCGPGYSSKKIMDSYSSNVIFEGSDIRKDLIEIAKKQNPNSSFTEESIYELKREQDSFDLVVGLEILEHLDDPFRALEEIKRVSSQYLLLSVPREPIWRMLNIARLKYLSDFGNTPTHVNHWSTKSFIKFASQAGEVVEVKTPLPWTIVLVDLKK